MKRKKKNPNIENDAPWSDFDKAIVNKIKTTWANESPVESSPICLTAMTGRKGEIPSRNEFGEVGLSLMIMFGHLPKRC